MIDLMERNANHIMPSYYHLPDNCRSVVPLRALSHIFNFLIKPTGKGPLKRPRPKGEDNIRVDLKEIHVNARIWVDSAKNRDYWRVLVNAALNLRFHKPRSQLIFATQTND